MLVIPIAGKISWRNPPFVTIGIIIINAFVFFSLQQDEDRHLNKAFEFYVQSGLAKMEANAYLDYKKSLDKPSDISSQKSNRKLGEKAVAKLCQEMQDDTEFIKKLRNDEIITPEDSNYPRWKELRIGFEEKLSHVFSWKYGFRPAEKPIFPTLTYMFLHGSFGHLLGNMIFLWIVGCVLEIGCGRILYLTIYLITGACSAWFFYLFNVQSTIPLIGASGSISGLMGAYTVLYGKSKIRVFYSLGFYFNYSKIPAIILLPIWIGNEIFQLGFGEATNIAYLGHIGGLLSGSFLGYIAIKFTGITDENIFQEDPKERISILLEESLNYLGKLDLEKARNALNKVFEIENNNKEALIQSFNIEKLDPKNDNFHKAASRLILYLTQSRETHHNMCMIYKEYRSISNKLRLEIDLLFRVSTILCSQGFLSEAEGLLAVLIKRKPELNRIPGAILNLGRAYLKKGMRKKGLKCLKIISHKYPQSPENRVAVDILRKTT
ncbi:rhomboid family intramembrane serine protease [Thermodesulfobacteriota bacterium]